MQIIFIRWRDAYLREGWHSRQEIESILKESVWIVESVGWLVDQNDDRLIICQSTSSNDSCSELLKIPAEAIVDMQILAEPKGKDSHADT